MGRWNSKTKNISEFDIDWVSSSHGFNASSHNSHHLPSFSILCNLQTNNFDIRKFAVIESYLMSTRNPPRHDHIVLVLCNIFWYVEEVKIWFTSIVWQGKWRTRRTGSPNKSETINGLPGGPVSSHSRSISSTSRLSVSSSYSLTTTTAAAATSAAILLDIYAFSRVKTKNIQVVMSFYLFLDIYVFIFLLLERDFLDLLVVISWSHVVMSCIYREIETTRQIYKGYRNLFII